MSSLQTANDATFDAIVLNNSTGPVLVDFWAPWCMPCRMQGPILEEYLKNNPEQTIVKVNVDESPEVARRYGIRSIPTIGVFHNGELVAQGVGVHEAHGLDHLLSTAKAA